MTTKKQVINLTTALFDLTEEQFALLTILKRNGALWSSDLEESDKSEEHRRKLSIAFLEISREQFDWLQVLKAEPWSEVDCEKCAWHVAFAGVSAGLGKTVIRLLVEEGLRRAKIPIPKGLHTQIYGAEQAVRKPAPPPDPNRPPVPKPPNRAGG